VKRSGTNYFNAMATEAAFGGVELYVPYPLPPRYIQLHCTSTDMLFHSALFIASLVFVSLQLHRHRKEGGHCQPGSLQTAPPPTVQQTAAASQWPAPMPPVLEEPVHNVQMQTQQSSVISRAELPQEGQQMYQQPAHPKAQYGYNALPVAGVDDAYYDNP
jgi:hypothetical protein